MKQKKFNENRRDFLTTVIPLTVVACLGCKGALARQMVQDSNHKFSEKFGLTTEETYSFFYGSFIPVLQALSKEMGSEKFNALFMKVAKDNTGQMIAAMTKDLPEKDMKAFSAFMMELIGTPPYNNVLTGEVVEQTDKVFELKYTECLPAKLLRAMNAVDIGLAMECSGAEAAAKAFNPKMSYSNPKNLMKGDSYCIERFTLEA